MNSRFYRIQISVVVLICFFTLPWVLSDPGTIRPRLATDDQDRYLPVSWTLVGSSKRRLRLTAVLSPTIGDPEHLTIELLATPRYGAETVLPGATAEIVKSRGNSGLRSRVRFYAMLPNGFQVKDLDGARLSVRVADEHSDQLTFAGTLNSSDRRLRITEPALPSPKR